MKILLVNNSSVRMPQKFIGNWLKQLRRALHAKKVRNSAKLGEELTVVFLDTKAAKAINNSFRNRNYATDVLSFAGEGLGELVLCPQVLRRQSLEHELSFQEELGYMLIHGVLHLLGYDHEQGGLAEKRMMALQDEVFDTLRKRFILGRRGKKHVNRRRNL